MNLDTIPSQLFTVRKKMKQLMKSLILVSLCSAMTACFQSKQDYTVNPDSSGKVVVQNTIDLATNPFGGGGKVNTKELAKKAVEDFLANPSIEAWKDVSCEIKDNKLIIKGTGYFTNVTKVDFMPKGPKKSGGNENELAFEKQEDGSLKLYFKPEKKDAEAKELTDAEVDTQYKQEKEQYAMFKSMITMMKIDELKVEQNYSFSGTITKNTVYKKNENGSYGLIISGAAILKANDEFMNDEKAFKASLKTGTQESIRSKKMFGSDETPILVIKDAKSSFDYKKEMEAAKANMEDMKKKVLESIK